MSLSAFISEHHEQVIREFATFARTLMPAGADMTETELRDHAEAILTAIAQDIATPQTAQEQSQKSQGRGFTKVMEASGRLHADDRIQHGFTFRAVLAEFRALRATVLRLYEESGDSDLTGVSRFNEAIDEAMTESMDRFAHQADLFRDQFIGVLSHDLRTPLGAITAGAALLAQPEDNPERRGWIVTRLLTSAQRMQRMINDLLDLTRVRLGGLLPVVRKPANLEELCDDALMDIRATYPAALFQLQTTGDLRGEWDPDRLVQLVTNLVGNAIQHGDGVPVTVTCRDLGNCVTLAVHNRGAPIPPDVLPVVFEPLTRGPGNTATHNMGLGLFIVRAIVLAHGGRIEVSSSREAGTTFGVTLPRSA